MESLMKKVEDIYRAIAALPEDSPLFRDQNLKITWIEMSGGPYGGVYSSMGEVLSGVFSRIGAAYQREKNTGSQLFFGQRA